MSDYQDFLASKVVKPEPAGFAVPKRSIERRWAKLFPFQRRIVDWSLRLGRAAVFADCGLGKTLVQLTWANEVVKHTGRPVLILTPLAVGPQTVEEGKKFGVKATLCRSMASVDPRGVNVTNYQKLLDKQGGLSANFDPAAFAGIVLDESSILKSYTGKTKQVLIDAFRSTPFRLACTATPAPNDYLELGNHAQFLGVMDSNEMISRWFINDAAHVGRYRLKKHAEEDYWRWVASWAVCVGKPSDLGDSDDGFELPPLHLRETVVDVDESADQAGWLFRCGALTATTLHEEMRRTAEPRAEALARLVNDSDEAWVVWCHTNYEADPLAKLIPDAVEVRGSDSEDRKEEKLADFAHGRKRVIITKPSLAGFGLNWQHCRNIAFVGLSYSHEQFYQAVRRSWRFGQKLPVNCHIVYASTEGEVPAAIRRKQEQLDTMRSAMAAATRTAILDAADNHKELATVEHRTVQSDSGLWTMHHGDCVQVCQSLPDQSIDLTVFSPPFSTLYIYSDSLADMGNSADDAEFFRHFGYLVPELYRVTVPGRLCVVHCKDLPRYAGSDGTAGLKDFPGELVRLFESHGWSYHSRVTIWKCPVIERERTNNNGLLHKTVCRDSSQVRQGMADYLLVFRRPPEGTLLSDKPIAREPIIEIVDEQEVVIERGGFKRFVGAAEFDPRENRYHPSPYARKSPPSAESIAVWQRYADPVWWDIDQMDVLNYKLAREGQDEKHICPLQLGLIRRVVELWSNPGDVVLSPFAGIGSEGYVAIGEGRKFVGVELKESYFNHARKHLTLAEEALRQQTLFDGKSLDRAPSAEDAA